MFDPNKPYALRNGLKAEILGTIKAEILGTIKESNGPVFAVRVSRDNGSQFCIFTNLEGQYMPGRCTEQDLVNIKTKHTGYIGIYNSTAPFPETVYPVYTGSVYKNRADILPSPSLLTIVEVSWED